MTGNIATTSLIDLLCRFINQKMRVVSSRLEQFGLASHQTTLINGFRASFHKYEEEQQVEFGIIEPLAEDEFKNVIHVTLNVEEDGVQMTCSSAQYDELNFSTKLTLPGFDELKDCLNPFKMLA